MKRIYREEGRNMATFRCENCGAQLDSEDSTEQFVTCEYCGSKAANPCYKENDAKLKNITKTIECMVNKEVRKTPEGKPIFNLVIFVILLMFGFWPGLVYGLVCFSRYAAVSKKEAEISKKYGNKDKKE